MSLHFFKSFCIQKCNTFLTTTLVKTVFCTIIILKPHERYIIYMVQTKTVDCIRSNRANLLKNHTL